MAHEDLNHPSGEDLEVDHSSNHIYGLSNGLDNNDTIGSSGLSSGATINPGNGTNGVIHNDRFDDQLKETEEPKFDVDPVQLQFDIDNLKQLLVKNNIMYLIMESLIYKIDLDNPAVVKLFQFAKDTTITNCWLSPNGQHFIVQVNDSTYFYLYNHYDKFKVLPRFKGFMIKLIHFPTYFDLNESTGEMLIVTKDNSIYIANIKSHTNQDNKKDDKYLKLIYNLSVGSIIGVNFTNNNLTINLVTDKNILQWDCFDNSYNELIKVFKTNPKVVSMHLKSPSLIDNGSDYLLISTVNNSNQIISNDSELLLSKLNKLNPMASVSDSPNSMILSKHHIIALSKNHNQLVIFSKLSNQPPKLLDLNSFLVNGNEHVLGVTADYSSNTFWLYSKHNIYELVITNESSLVWFNYYKMGKYDEALNCLQSLNNNDMNGPEDSNYFKKDMILIKQGYDYLQKGAFGVDYDEKDETDLNFDLISLQIKGIKILADLSEPFEKICLMLMNLQNNHSIVSKSSLVSERLLVEYLLVKFKHSKNVEKNKLRIIVLSSWIIESMLRIIYKLEADLQILNNNENSLLTNKGSSFHSINELKLRFLNEFNDKFNTFINQNYSVLDSKTVYQIMNQLNYNNRLVYLAELNKDYEFILNYYIELEDWESSLKILLKMYSTDFKTYEDIIYKKSTILLVNYPSMTIETWLKFSDLNYEKLLPSLLIYCKANKLLSIFDNYGILFLQKIIFGKNIRSKIVNNYYLSLLITYPIDKALKEDGNNPSTYINKQIIKILNFIKLESKLYDSGLILRLCLDYNHIQPAIIILINDMKLFEPALKLAIDNDLIDLSTYILNKFNDSIDNESSDLEESGLSENFDVSINSDMGADNTTNPNNGNSGESSINIGKNKLHHKNFTVGKKLWLMFAKYLIEGTVRGRKFEVLDSVEISEVDEDKSILDNGINNNDKGEGDESIVKNLTNGIANLIKPKDNTNGEPGTLTLSQANKVLKYLLDSSYNNAINSSFLSLKDLLPIFPESIMVNNFKTEIIRSLNNYNNKINQLSMEMKESLAISNGLNAQIKESNDTFKKGKVFTIIEPGDPCKLCNKLLISKNFISFPNCGHNYHKDCLIKHFLMLKGDYRFKKVFHNFKKNSSTTNKKELDGIMLSECVLCNESNIISIDNNLVGDSTKDLSLAKEWAL